MHPRLTELFAYADHELSGLKAAYDRVPAAERAVRPAGGGWSADDILTHIALLERRLAAVIATRLADARGAGLARETDESPILPTIDLTGVLDRDGKLVAPAHVDPRTRDERLSWSEVEEARAAFKDAYRSGDGMALGTVTMPHPVFGPLTLYQWLAFAGGHAARHAAQMRELVPLRDSQQRTIV